MHEGDTTNPFTEPEPVSVIPALIDTHVHLDDDRFDTDRDEVVRNAADAGVCGMIVPATTQSRWAKIINIAAHYDHVHPTCGLHPMFCTQHEDAHLEQLIEALPSVVAIGECGLDKQRHTVDLKLQRHYFEAQVAIAGEHSVPLIIHARNTVEEIILILKQAGLNRPKGNGVVHSFNGSLEQAHRLIDLNFSVSFGGPVTFENARRLHEIVTKLPLQSIMLETDAPDQPGMLHRGERNEPRWIVEVLKRVADLRGMNTKQIAEANNRNARNLFKLEGTDT